jgi:uncharacterized protein YydD (DUF2326 family)
MFLKRLLIQNGQETIRDIIFHKGVNLIVDETPQSETQQTTGNNVGKTTVLRLIDFCFGGDGKNIYQDTEFKKQPNTVVENFLKKNNIIITVVLVENIEDNNSREIIIKRNFLSRKNKIQEINRENIDNDNFDYTLKKLIFNTKIEKPTFRQVISKNIRDEKNRMTNIVKVLNPYTRPEEYEALYLFWLGLEFADMNKKYLLSEEKKSEERLQKRLKKTTSSLSLIEQTLLIINRKIKELDNKKNTFSLNPNYKDDIDKLNETKYQLNKVSSQLGKLELRRDLILESKEDLEKQYTEINTTQIKLLYEKAKSLIPNIQVSFENTVKFHNDLVSKKLKYITNGLPDLQKSIAEANSNLIDLSRLETELTEKLQKVGIAEDLEKIVSELNQQYEKRGRLEEQKQFWEDSVTRLRDINQSLEKINNGIISQDRLIKDRIAEFNKYFTEISNKLYGEEYLLSPTPPNERGYDLIVTNMEGNPSTGKKKGQISAFDFAYILFADNMNINCLHFIMHDQIENIHSNQLNTLFDVANDINCQYIVPILRDKMPPNVDVNKFEVLSLSQDDKLFRI